MKDDQDWMDELQRTANTAIDELLPFAPDEEVRNQTPHEEPEDADVTVDENGIGEEIDRIEREFGNVEIDLGLEDEL